MTITIQNITGVVIRNGHSDIFLTENQDMFLMINNQLIPVSWDLENQILIEIRDFKRLISKKDRLAFEDWILNGFCKVFQS